MMDYFISQSNVPHVDFKSKLDIVMTNDWEIDPVLLLTDLHVPSIVPCAKHALDDSIIIAFGSIVA